MSREALEHYVTSALEHVTEVLSGETSLRSIDGLIWSAIDDLQTAQRMLERIVEREGF